MILDLLKHSIRNPKTPFLKMKPFTTLPPFLSLAAGMCHHGTKLAARQEAVDYSYHNTQGALLWQTLTPEFEVCATGNNQSPIDLDGSIETVEGSQYQLKIDSYPRGIELENLGNTVQGSLNGSAIFGDEEYSLVQLHFHTPSEHHIDGEYYPAEVHFVFQNDGELPVYCIASTPETLLILL